MDKEPPPISFRGLQNWIVGGERPIRWRLRRARSLVSETAKCDEATRLPSKACLFGDFLDGFDGVGAAIRLLITGLGKAQGVRILSIIAT